MKKRYDIRSGLGGFLIFLCCLWGTALQAQAAMADSPYVTFSPGGDAFTTNAGDVNTRWYEMGTTIETGIGSRLRQPGVGEHIYSHERTDEIPVGKWVVRHRTAKCIHDNYPAQNLYYGVPFQRQCCMSPYYSGWFAYCADCGELIDYMYFYMSKEAAGSITSVDVSLAYYYKCPHCDNLEMGHELAAHNCQDISANRYFVRYHANYGSGHMEKSTHMYGNADVYEGKQVTPQTALNLNTYKRVGYRFTGWNTKRDGSGAAYADGASVYNLTDVDNGSVILYAQWEKCQSELLIDPGGGTYRGKRAESSIMGRYGESYVIDMDALIAPQGYTVHFDTRGGTAVEDITGTRCFYEWSCRQPFYGKLTDNTYAFSEKDGISDRICAIYTEEAIRLPDTVKNGYSFGGWYLDEACTKPAGNAGNLYTPSGNVTLYACWVELVLTAVNNDTANSGRGAVNLKWTQKDNREKLYKLYQRREDTDWVQISDAEEVTASYRMSDTIGYTGKTGSLVIPYSGFYRITLYGAQGGDYGQHAGGKGGMVQAVIYLEKGEKLTYEIGGKEGYAGGGRATLYGNGGGLSSLSSEEKGLLLIAGGGGGASSVEDGGEGGRSVQASTSQKGETGVSGGGGGYRGGAAGTVETHQHSASCKHEHVGNPNMCGGCYTKPVQCQNTAFTQEEYGRTFYYGNIADDGSFIFCVRCGSYECPGHTDSKYRYVCNACGAVYENSHPARCTSMKRYELSCGREEGYLCGMYAGQILKSSPAYGGSNYINSSLCISFTEKAGVQSGNGFLAIESEQIGMWSDNYLNGVTATDLAAPDPIDAATVVKTAIGEDEIRICFEKPCDNGTVYYHKAESYSKETNAFLCTSNLTRNTLTSGIAGYRYTVDALRDTQAGKGHTYLAPKTDKLFLTVKADSEIKYLHVAAEDRAGNIGPSIHILISDQDLISWPLRTEKIRIDPGDNMYPAGEPDTYYVKADGSTPFCVSFEGLLCGKARKDYQIGYLSFLTKCLSEDAGEGKYTVITPVKSDIAPGTFTYRMEQLQKIQDGILCVEDASYTVVKRYNLCKSVELCQKFTLSKEYDAARIRLSPQAGAKAGEEMVYSEESNDLENSIYLIADALPPVIEGMESLQSMDHADYSDGRSLRVELYAEDKGSGLDRFYAEVRNLENGSIVKYEDKEGDGRICFTISDQEPVFCGEFIIMVYAGDHVGNESSEITKLLGMGLNAYIERVLEPHDGSFKRGESGILHIITVGYVERVEVSFPEEFAKEDSTYNRIYRYDIPEYLQYEEMEFVVPLTVSDGEKTVLVKAFKDGKELDTAPGLITINIKGSVLDELRTRLR